MEDEYHCVNCDESAPQNAIPLRCRDDYDPIFSEDPRVFSCEKDYWREVEKPHFETPEDE